MNWLLNVRIQRAAEVLWAGGVVAYPTEAVWGIGCDPHDVRAVDHVLALKGRAAEKGMILIAAGLDQVAPYLGRISACERNRLAEKQPLPTTWLVPAGPLAPAWITGGRRTLAVRITDHPLAAALCRKFGGPIVSTSANPQGLRPARSALKVRCYFPGEQVHVVAGPLGGASKPSEIRDLQTGDILRAGG